MITYQSFTQETMNGNVISRYNIDCLSTELDTMPSFLKQNGSKAITTDEGKVYVYDKANERWNAK